MPKKNSIGTRGRERCAVGCLLLFAALCKKLDAIYASLDAFFVGGGGVIDINHLFDAEVDHVQCIQRREEQAGEDFRVFNMPVGSFRTYSIPRVYSQVGATAISSLTRQFPTSNVFMGAAIARSRAVSAVRSALHPELD